MTPIGCNISLDEIAQLNHPCTNNQKLLVNLISQMSNIMFTNPKLDFVLNYLAELIGERYELLTWFSLSELKLFTVRHDGMLSMQQERGLSSSLDLLSVYLYTIAFPHMRFAWLVKETSQ